LRSPSVWQIGSALKIQTCSLSALSWLKNERLRDLDRLRAGQE
jgi:hypothetical protein